MAFQVARNDEAHVKAANRQRVFKHWRCYVDKFLKWSVAGSCIEQVGLPAVEEIKSREDFVQQRIVVCIVEKQHAVVVHDQAFVSVLFIGEEMQTHPKIQVFWLHFLHVVHNESQPLDA